MAITDRNLPKTRYNDAELAEFKALIEAKLVKAEEQRDFYLDQIRGRADDADTKVRGLDDGTGTAELERLTTLAARQEKHVTHLKNALLRIENKVYGICRVTGTLIGKERLRAVPHATLSIGAKQNR